MNYGILKSGLIDELEADIKACAAADHNCGRELKVILETDALTTEEIKQGCHICERAGYEKYNCTLACKACRTETFSSFASNLRQYLGTFPYDEELSDRHPYCLI